MPAGNLTISLEVEGDRGGKARDEVTVIIRSETNPDEQILEFEDPNFLEALLVVKEIEIYNHPSGFTTVKQDVDENRDGQISIGEAKKVKALILYNQETDRGYNITSMPEIKYFTSLTHLRCDGNLLTALDVSECSALMNFDCSNNQLTSINISGLKSLQYLTCGHNDLETIDASGCTGLVSVTCYDNQLAKLDFSESLALELLYCSENQLTSLDLSGYSALTHLDCVTIP